MSEFGGILRGIVVDNNDPLKIGRLKIRVEAAYGQQPVDNLPWAWPCFSYGGAPDMCNYTVPEKGAGVWVMFQNKDGQPDTTYPVWLGVWQAQKEVPPEVEGDSSDAHYYKEFRTTSGHYALFCDKPDEEFIEVKDKNGSYIKMQDGNLEIYAAKDITILAGGNMKLSASRIDLN